MNFISTRAHALLDYVFGIVLFAAPWLFDFLENPVPKAICLTAGITVGTLSLFTKYEGGLIPVIPLPAHLLFDIICGLFLVAAPWLFGFHEQFKATFIVFGSIQIVVTLLTRVKTGQTPDPDRAMP
jgi:hypothetical protein